MTLRRSRHLAVIQFAPATDKETALRAFPRNRGECEDGERPCPWLNCKHHLEHGGESCALDVADEGPQTQERVAELLGVSQERVHFLEKRAIRKARGYTG